MRLSTGKSNKLDRFIPVPWGKAVLYFTAGEIKEAIRRHISFRKRIELKDVRELKNG